MPHSPPAGRPDERRRGGGAGHARGASRKASQGPLSGGPVAAGGCAGAAGIGHEGQGSLSPRALASPATRHEHPANSSLRKLLPRRLSAHSTRALACSY